MTAEEVPDARPRLERGFDAVHRSGRAEERVTGVVVAVELEVLARGAQRFFLLDDLFRRRVLILLAEQAEERARACRA